MRGARPAAALDERIVRSGLLAPGSRIVAALSGGPDSVALAVLLARVAPRLDIEVVFAHVNHAVRSSAGQDECVAASVAARLGGSLHVERLTPGRAHSEAVLRAQRYAALAAIARTHGAAAVATGHTAEDQTETVLLALFRGTGRTGLAGMRRARPLEGDVTLVRPLLDATHDELARELGRAGMPYARDPTNREKARGRNAVRAALAGLRDVFPGLDRAASRCAAILADEGDGTERARRRRHLRALIEREGSLRDVPFERIEAAAALLPSSHARRVFIRTGLELEIGGEIENARVR